MSRGGGTLLGQLLDGASIGLDGSWPDRCRKGGVGFAIDPIASGVGLADPSVEHSAESLFANVRIPQMRT